MTNVTIDKQKRLIEFIIVSFLVILTRVVDLGSTYILTPNLDYESNPFVKVLGVNWVGFVAIQLLFLILVMGVNYYSLFKTKMVYPQQKGLSFNKFQRYYMFGRGVEKNRPLMRLEWIGKVHLGFIGYLLPRVLILYSTIIVTIHALIFYGIPVPRYYLYFLYLFLLFGVVLLNKLFHLAHYRVYKKISG